MPFTFPRGLIALAAVAIISPTSFHTDAGPEPPFGRLPMTFVANAGQADSAVSAHSIGIGSPMTVFFTQRDVQIVLARDHSRAAVAITLSGSQTSRVELSEPTAGRVNYITATARQSELTAYQEVLYRGAWPGVDVRFRGENARLTYELLLSPGARVDDLQLRIDGAETVTLTDTGALRIATAAGDLIDDPPDTYQIVDGRRRQVPSRFVVSETGNVRFEVGAYDHAVPLVIDPSIAYLSYANTGFPNAFGIAVDAVGALHVTGIAFNSSLPVRLGPQDPGGQGDAVVAKLSPAGDAVEYLTILGGSGMDEARDIALDVFGNVFITGVTESADFPVTTGVFRTAKGAARDGFVAKLSPHGTSLAFSTFLGANAATEPASIVLDARGQPHIAGSTHATNLPRTAGAISIPRVTPDTSDAFLLKLNASGTSVLYATYVGGTGVDEGRDVAVDDWGNAYLLVGTTSSALPTTPGAVQPTMPSQPTSYVAKIRTTGAGSALQYATYVGPSRWSQPVAIAIEPATELAYVALSADPEGAFPTSDGTPLNAGTAVVKLNASGTEFLYARGVGPSYDTIAHALDVVTDGIAYVGGVSGDTSGEAWVSRIDPNGLEAHRFVIAPNCYGGPCGVTVGAIAARDDGSVYLAGFTSTLLPVTPHAAQTAFGNGYVAKVSFADIGAVNLARDATVVASSSEAAYYAPAMAVDGDRSTRWSSGFRDPQWLTVDLGQRYRVDRIVLFWEVAYAGEYELHISDDGINWYPLLSPVGQGNRLVDGGTDNHLNLSGVGRYVRVFGYTRATRWGYSLWEIEIYGTPVSTPPPPAGSVNLTRLGYNYALASSEQSSSYDPGYAIDGNRRSRWSSAFSDPEWIQVFLGGPTFNISRVVLRWETAYAADYLIQVSDDGVSWKTVSQVVNGDGGTDSHTVSAVGRYVRMYGTRRATPWGYSLWEFEVYGTINTELRDVILQASDVVRGTLPIVNDPTAAGGRKVSSANTGWASTERPPAVSEDMPYVDFFLTVPHGGTYRLWMRLKARDNSKWNDSVWIQFSGARVNWTPAYEWRTEDALLVNLEDCWGCGVQGWGWQDNSWWLNQPSAVALSAGSHLLRVLLREDGVEFDQIVLSPVRYRTTPPGAVKNDNTMLVK